jgi:hypothetical protein
MPYRRIVGMEVGDEGSRFAMLASFVSQPTNKELCAKVGDGMRGKSAYRRGVRSLYFSTQGVIRPDRHSSFPTLRLEHLADPLIEVFATARERFWSGPSRPKSKEECTDEAIEKSTDFR